jgi:hypothetical protein
MSIRVRTATITVAALRKWSESALQQVEMPEHKKANLP